MGRTSWVLVAALLAACVDDRAAGIPLPAQAPRVFVRPAEETAGAIQMLQALQHHEEQQARELRAL